MTGEVYLKVFCGIMRDCLRNILLTNRVLCTVLFCSIGSAADASKFLLI
jgi:hypothetical protein